MVQATMVTLRPPSDRTHFHIAIICALPREADAVALLFDHFWDEGRDTFGRADNDTNTYITGRIGAHNVVLAVLPSMGTNSAAAAAASLRSSYTHIRLAALVGICGGVPRIGGLDVFLGDVVISKTIVQYDYGRQYPGHFAVKNTVEDSLARANKDIRGLLAVFETEHMREILQSEATTHLQDLQQTARKKRRRAGYQFPGTAEDRLYRATYAHKHRGSCAACAGEAAPFCEGALKASCIELGCGTANLIERERPAEADGTCPEIFIGRIGSGNTVMKSGDDRDRIAAQHDIVAYEMEGAGAWDELPCLIVKGVCDYADSHKDKAWQDFAAATAAAVTKAVLGRYIARDEDRVPTRTSDRQTRAGGQNVSSNSFGNNAWIFNGDVGGDVTF